ncbi:malate dehydrogenase, NAD-dependent [Mycotypha africana]|uniref:malate dehydrogenase, NAD-dependent n=1 Tax=Mycotypha africana TaxID=64632 RepID=UPI0023001A76|nr:malate dehydrogenase, NAD-dependent [Mycotypha africana]KAI8991149.1 malate dehydrogenase, NAD-dependent [Mycotypha africana]
MVKVTVCGASGGIGQPLSLLLKQSNLISQLALYDIVNTHGVAADLSHIDTHSKVTGHVGPKELEEAIKGADVVVIPAGIPRKPGMSRDDLFKINANIVRELAVAAANYAPHALMCIISNPVNSMVPVVSEVFKKYNVYDPRRIFGVTTLDLVRSSTFLAELFNKDPRQVNVPVIGGHSGVTIIPLLSQATNVSFGDLSEEQVQQLTKRIQFAGDEVVKAKNGSGSATLSMAYAGARFTLNVIEAVFGGVSRTECAYVNLQADPNGGAQNVWRIAGDKEIDYFSVPVEFGKNGIQRILPIGKISKYEYKLLKEAVAELKSNIVKGTSFITDDSKL